MKTLLMLMLAAVTPLSAVGATSARAPTDTQVADAYVSISALREQWPAPANVPFSIDISGGNTGPDVVQTSFVLDLPRGLMVLSDPNYGCPIGERGWVECMPLDLEPGSTFQAGPDDDTLLLADRPGTYTVTVRLSAALRNPDVMDANPSNNTASITLEIRPPALAVGKLTYSQNGQTVRQPRGGDSLDVSLVVLDKPTGKAPMRLAFRCGRSGLWGPWQPGYERADCGYWAPGASGDLFRGSIDVRVGMQRLTKHFAVRLR